MAKVTPVSTSNVDSTKEKKSGRGKSPKVVKKVSPNITDQAAAQKSEKKSPAVKEKKISKTLTAKPITDLGAVKFTPKWVKANIAEHLQPVKDGKFSFLALYLKVRELASSEGKVYSDLTVGELLELLKSYAEANPDTPVGERILNLKPLQLRDLKARLTWCLVPTLRIYDAQEKGEDEK